MRHILLIALLGPFTPRRVAQRTLSASRTTVVASYLLGLVIGCAVLVGAIVAVATISPTVTTIVTGGGTTIVPHQAPSGGQIILMALGCAFAAVVVTWVGVVIALPYGWRDEPLRDTWQHCVRTVHLFAPAWMPFAAACAGSFVMIFNIKGLGPVVVMLLAPVVTIGALRAVTIIMLAASVDRPVDELTHDPRCESCGYLLHHLPDSLRCPECGDDLSRSIDPHHRYIFHPTASAPEKRTLAEQFVIDTPSVAAWTLPEALFSRTCLAAPITPLVKLFATWFLMTVAGSLLCLAMAAIVVGGGPPPIEALYVIVYVACALVTAVFGAWSIGTSIVGLIASAQTGRNLLRAVLIVTSCTSGYFAGWAAICLIAGCLVPLSGMGRIPIPVYYVVPGWLIMNGVLALIYIFAVWRRVRYVRYGNWQFPNRPTAEPELEAAQSNST
ncbi:MAG: hypothetical protein H6817_10695 [Phycisphaerales bacterium]|nr:hypothetical protein [Phycisphaerales bacterium]